MRSARRTGQVVAMIAGLVVMLSGCSPAAGRSQDPQLPANPLAGAGLWTDPRSTAQRQADVWVAQGDSAAADSIAPIASQPVATWFSSSDDPYAEAERVTTAAAAAGQVPVLVAYHRPDRDCGSYSGGGSKEGPDYLAWLGRLAAGIGARRAVVVLEPDAVAQAISGQCGGADAVAGVHALLGQAVDVLKQQPDALVYVDAGHSDWIGDLGALASALDASGVRRADGFSLNVANFRPTTESLDYGARLSARLGSAQFVVDVSRNGAPPPTVTDGIDAWCNPPGAGLGENPRVGDAQTLAVAFLWVKEPGASDGDCRPGEPRRGLLAGLR